MEPHMVVVLFVSILLAGILWNHGGGLLAIVLGASLIAPTGRSVSNNGTAGGVGEYDERDLKYGLYKFIDEFMHEGDPKSKSPYKTTHTILRPSGYYDDMGRKLLLGRTKTQYNWGIEQQKTHPFYNFLMALADLESSILGIDHTKLVYSQFKVYDEIHISLIKSFMTRLEFLNNTRKTPSYELERLKCLRICCDKWYTMLESNFVLNPTIHTLFINSIKYAIGMKYLTENISIQSHLNALLEFVGTKDRIKIMIQLDIIIKWIADVSKAWNMTINSTDDAAILMSPGLDESQLNNIARTRAIAAKIPGILSSSSLLAIDPKLQKRIDYEKERLQKMTRGDAYPGFLDDDSDGDTPEILILKATMRKIRMEKADFENDLERIAAKNKVVIFNDNAINLRMKTQYDADMAKGQERAAKEEKEREELKAKEMRDFIEARQVQEKLETELHTRLQQETAQQAAEQKAQQDAQHAAQQETVRLARLAAQQLAAQQAEDDNDDAALAALEAEIARNKAAQYDAEAKLAALEAEEQQEQQEQSQREKTSESEAQLRQRLNQEIQQAKITMKRATRQQTVQKYPRVQQQKESDWTSTDDIIPTMDPRNPVSVAQYLNRYHITATANEFARLLPMFPGTYLLNPADIHSMDSSVHIKHYLGNALTGSRLNSERFSPLEQWQRDDVRREFFFKRISENPSYYIKNADFWRATDKVLKYVPIAPPEVLVNIINKIDPRRILDVNVMFGSAIAALALAKPQSATYDGLCMPKLRESLEALVLHASSRPTFPARINLIPANILGYTPARAIYDMIISEIRTRNSEIITGEAPMTDSLNLPNYLSERITPMIEKVVATMTSTATVVFLLTSANPDLGEVTKHIKTIFSIKDTIVSSQYTALVCNLISK